MSQAQQSGLKDSVSLTKWIKWFLYAQVVVSIIAIMSGMLEYQFLAGLQNGVYATQELAEAAEEASDVRQGVVAVLQLMVFPIAVILMLKWIYRANYNAHQLGAPGMKFTPGWSIGWYFLPIANLWKPYQAMKEIWKASSNPLDWKNQPTSSLLPWWWFFWIASGVFGYASLRLILSAQELNKFIMANVLFQLTDVTQILLNMIVISMVDKIHHMQVIAANTQKNHLIATAEHAVHVAPN